ncbi:MAG: ribonuclease E/G, partial [Blautia sp.]|nr:ribonuclease E/G [Blautia sp.]
DSLLPLWKLYSLGSALAEALNRKVWLPSGGFLVIEQTEAFAAIDVNTGKCLTGKNPEETFRRINLEAAREIARQLRLRNLSGMILIDFINMKDPSWEEELFQAFSGYLYRDPVKCKAVDITALHILEMTRRKVRRSLAEEIQNIRDN